MLSAILQLLRPKQWTKNLLVFAALLFTAAFDTNSIRLSVLAFLAMCLASSATYVFNDLFDAKRDRNHPKKKDRPIARGAVPASLAALIGAVLAIEAVHLAWSVHRACGMVVLGYYLLQLAYNIGLKHVAITDVFLISLGFLLRAVMGPMALQVEISNWLLICTMTLALMLGFAKRRDEVMRSEGTNGGARESLQSYSLRLLDPLVAVFASTSMISYGIYASESVTARTHPGLLLTALFVTYGITRYVYRVLKGEIGEEPETVLLTDPHILVAVLGFLLSAGLSMTNQWAKWGIA